MNSLHPAQRCLLPNKYGFFLKQKMEMWKVYDADDKNVDDLTLIRISNKSFRLRWAKRWTSSYYMYNYLLLLGHFELYMGLPS